MCYWDFLAISHYLIMLRNAPSNEQCIYCCTSLVGMCIAEFCLFFLCVSAVILPYYKNGKTSGTEENPKDIVFRRHAINRMPIDCWNDVWEKLHQQTVNVDVINVDAVPAEVYSTIATAVVWSMRLALAVGFFVWIDNLMRPIYAKLIPCDLGTPLPTPRIKVPAIKRHALGSLGKSRSVQCFFSISYPTSP